MKSIITKYVFVKNKMETQREDWKSTRAAQALIRYWLKYGMKQLIEEVLKRRDLMVQENVRESDAI